MPIPLEYYNSVSSFKGQNRLSLLLTYYEHNNVRVATFDGLCSLRACLLLPASVGYLFGLFVCFFNLTKQMID